MDQSRYCPLCDGIRPDVRELIIHIRVDHRRSEAADAVMLREMEINEQVQAFSSAVNRWGGLYGAGDGAI